MRLAPKFLEKRGKPEFVVLTIREFNAIVELLEDAIDLRDVDRARRESADETPAPFERAKARLTRKRQRTRRLPKR